MISKYLKWAIVFGFLSMFSFSQTDTVKVAEIDRQESVDLLAANGGMLSRPNRPGHVVGNTVRRVINRGRFR